MKGTLTEQDYARIGERITKLARRLRRRFCPWTDARDLVQEGWIQAMIALRNPRRDPAVDPFGYAVAAAHRAMITYSTRARSIASLPQRCGGSDRRAAAAAFCSAHPTMSLDAPIDDSDVTRHDVVADVRAVTDRVHAGMLTERVHAVLDEYEHGELAKLVLLDGWEPSAIALLHGVSVRTVRMAVTTATTALKSDSRLAALVA